MAADATIFKKGGAASAAGCVEGLHRFAQGATAPTALRVVDCRRAAMLIKSALWDWLSVSYGMIRILVIGSLRSPPKGDTAEWYMKYMTLCFSSPYFSFPLEGKREEAKGCTGQSTDRMLHRGPGRQSAACVIFTSYPWTHLRCEGSKDAPRGRKGARLTPRVV